jgi:hypothetical protein
MWSVLVLSAFLVGPISAVTASASPQLTVRVYDSEHHDYHRWDRSEQARYRAYLNEQHRNYVAYSRQRAAQRRAYWRWRHEHEDRR